MPAHDPRPANCRHRLQDEGKPYPRSSCSACGRGILSRLGRRCHHEVVAPAPEQIRGWVNVYRLSSGGVSFGRVQHSRENAEDVARSSAAPRIACIEINVPEGHGLEGDDA